MRIETLKAVEKTLVEQVKEAANLEKMRVLTLDEQKMVNGAGSLQKQVKN